jgi:hypothetical protein
MCRVAPHITGIPPAPGYAAVCSMRTWQALHLPVVLSCAGGAEMWEVLILLVMAQDATDHPWAKAPIPSPRLLTRDGSGCLLYASCVRTCERSSCLSFSAALVAALPSLIICTRSPSAGSSHSSRFCRYSSSRACCTAQHMTRHNSNEWGRDVWNVCA